MSKWKPDDKQWMAERKKRWKDVSYTLKHNVFFPDSYELRHFKEYFFTGTELALCRLKSMPGGLLLRLFLEPDLNLDDMIRIRQEYENDPVCSNDVRVSKRMLAVVVWFQNRRWQGESVFQGRDEMIFRTFFPTRLNRADYPEKTDDEWREFVEFEYEVYCSKIVTQLNEKVVPHYMVPLMVDYWVDAAQLGYAPCLNYMYDLVEFTDLIANSSPEQDEVVLSGTYEDGEAYEIRLAGCGDPKKRKFVQDVLTVLNDPSMPEEFVQEVATIRARIQEAAK